MHGVVDGPCVEQEMANDLLEAVDFVGIHRQECVLRVGICWCRPSMGRVLWQFWDRVGESLECLLSITRHRYSDMCVCIVPF
jgi:hypothetical protein